MNILFSTSEAVPFIKTGGLADVVPVLAGSLAKLKHKVFMVLPGYDAVLQKLNNQKVVATWVHPVTLQQVEIIASQDLAPVRLLVVKHSLFAHKTNPYTDGNAKDWTNNFETFALFSWAVAKIAYEKKVTGLATLDVVVSNDWQTGLVPVYIKHANEGNKANVKSAHIVHNIAFPGIFPAEHYAQLGLPFHYFQTEGMEYYGQISFQKAALYFADKIFTVSPQYAKEIKTYHQFGMGFEGLLSHRSDDVVGILNGADYDVWSPQTDSLIAQTYGLTTLKDKDANKKDLLNVLFPAGEVQEETPLVGMVTRLSDQKGIDVVIDFLHKDFFHKHFNLVILGSGDAHFTKALEEIAHQHKNVAFINKYDEAVAHKIIAGSDAFFMPSRFEPCGLTQLYAMKYGTLPIVFPVGGLKDSVVPFTGENDKEATGLYLSGMNIESFVSSFNMLHHIFAKKTLWNKLRKNAMRADFSWSKSAKVYESYFEKLM